MILLCVFCVKTFESAIAEFETDHLDKNCYSIQIFYQVADSDMHIGIVSFGLPLNLENLKKVTPIHLLPLLAI